MPFPLKTFYFLRHGETDLNQQNKIVGSVDVALNTIGHGQAIQASHLLAPIDFDVIVSSPRLRAVQTAEPLARLQNKTVILDERVAEKNWGTLEGVVFDPRTNWFDDANTPTGGEKASDFVQRIQGAVIDLLSRYERPLIVSHGGVFIAIAYLLGQKNLRSSNGIPFCFEPQLLEKNAWDIREMIREH